MSDKLVDYLVARTELPAPSGAAYDYVLGDDGLFVVAENRHRRARIPVAAGTVRGLPPLHAAVGLRGGWLPRAVWDRIITTMTEQAATEVVVAVVADGQGYRLVRPAQIGGPLRLRYRPVPDAVLEVHSHRGNAARFSTTDDADEQGLRLYGVVGRLGTTAPEVALRVGVYGYFLPLPWDAVFAGNRGPFRDVSLGIAEVSEVDG